MFLQRLIVVVLLLLIAAQAQAQEALTPGVPASGTLTEDTLRVEYTFEGTKGTPLVLEMVGVNPLEGLSEPALILMGPDGAAVTDATAWFQTLGGYGTSYIAAILPADGTYTLVATRTATGTSVGDYTVTVIEPTVLEAGTRYSGEVSSEGGFDFYVYNAKDRFYINFWRTGGDYTPELSVNTINPDDGSLTGLGYAYGQGSNYYALGFFEPGETYFIAVGEPEAVLSSAFYFDEETAAYELEIGFPAE